MTVIVFLIDTSASMMQKAYTGTTYLDFARLAVEQFLKQRQRDPNSKGDRYMLMTFDEYPLNVKAGWKESQAIFTEQLKNLRASGVCGFGTAVESVLRFVNLNRMQTGIEYYGYGRYPCFSEHVVIISVTDGSNSSSNNEMINFSRQLTIGNELTVEPFRWDHRLFSLVLRFPGYQTTSLGNEVIFSENGINGLQQQQLTALFDEGQIQALCSAMGGRSFCINSHRILSSSIEAILQKIQRNGVMIQLEKYPSDSIPSAVKTNNFSEQNLKENNNITDKNDDFWKTQSVMLILKPNKQGQGHWPIPEAFSVDSVTSNLPPRLARPVVLFCCEASEPLINQDFPFDKYELESCPLTQYILEKKEPSICWQVFVENSSRSGGIGYPFGYLKTSSNLQSVILFLMPYNYPALLPLLNDAKDIKMANSSAFRQKMEKYLLSIPPYYYSPLKKAFKRINLVIPFLEDYNQPIYSYSIVGLMAKMKHLGKEEFDLACITVAKNLENFQPALINGSQFVKASHCRITNLMKNSLLECKQHPFLQPYISTIPPFFKDLKICVNDSSNLNIITSIVPSAQFKNPFDIGRKSVISQLEKMRINFDQQVEINALHVLEGGMPGQKIKLQHAEDLHNQLISKMGDYQEYMRCLTSIGAAPLRELEPQAARPHAFGNPFKLDKKSIAVDEVGEVNTSSASNDSSSNETSTNEQRQRNTENRVKSPGFSSTTNGLATSYSSVPVAIRTKRKPGPLDQSLLTSWKRRRIWSMSSDCSDTSSVCSDITDISINSNIEMNEDDEEGEDKNFNDNEEFKQTSYSFDNDDIDSPMLIIYENGSNTDTLNEISTASTSTETIQTNGIQNEISNDVNHLSKKIKISNNTESYLSTARSPSNNNNGKEAIPLTANQLFRKQLDISRAVRGIGERHEVFMNCMNVLNDVMIDHERRFLIRFALTEARRFKRAELMKRLDHELRLIPSSVA